MKKATLFLLVLLIVSSTCFSGHQVTLAASAERQKGISYACWLPGLYSLPESDVSLTYLAETGASWISLIVTCYQETLGSTQILANESTPTDDDLIHVLGQAHALGLKVMLKPHVDLSKDPIHWRGEIGQEFTSEAQWGEWFASYRVFIEHYAELAAANGADQFCIGCELEGTTHRETDWRTVVASVRVRFAGPLVYASNHSGEETGLTWWDAVDFIGVDAYYQLSDHTNPSVEELKAAWLPYVEELASLATKWNKALILTEIGYRSLDGTAMYPWDYQVTGNVDLQEQADCYQAAFENFSDQPWFAGIFWWSWETDPFGGGPDDYGYTPQDKPAEDVLRAWFGGPRRSIRLAPEPDPTRSLDILLDGLSPGWEDRSWNAELDLAATDQVRSGGASLRARLGPWGGISFWHSTFISSPYHYVIFFIRGSEGTEPRLWAYFHDQNGTALGRALVNDPRFIENGHIEPGRWKPVIIPLRTIRAARRLLAGFSIQDQSGRGTGTFWVDSLQIVGAKRREERPRPSKKPGVR
jgi:hypothetical protein